MAWPKDLLLGFRLRSFRTTSADKPVHTCGTLRAHWDECLDPDSRRYLMIWLTMYALTGRMPAAHTAFASTIFPDW